MAYAKVQHKAAFGSATSVTATLDSTPIEGNLLVAFGSGYKAAANLSISGFTKVNSTSFSASGNFCAWCKVAGASESKDVVLACTESTSLNLIVFEFSGFTGTPTFDKTAATTYASGTSRSSGTTASTTADVELCLAAFRLGDVATNDGWTNSFTRLWYNGTSFIFIVGWYESSAAAARETTLSWTTTRLCGGIIVTFMGVLAAAWTPKVIMVD